MTPTPPIGVPRCYDGHVLPILYPGEVASARIDPEAVLEALECGLDRVPIAGWLVEPAPGWFATYQRVRWRIWGRWFSSGPAMLTTSIAARSTCHSPTPHDTGGD